MPTTYSVITVLKRQGFSNIMLHLMENFPNHVVKNSRVDLDPSIWRNAVDDLERQAFFVDAGYNVSWDKNLRHHDISTPIELELFLNLFNDYPIQVQLYNEIQNLYVSSKDYIVVEITSELFYRNSTEESKSDLVDLLASFDEVLTFSILENSWKDLFLRKSPFDLPAVRIFSNNPTPSFLMINLEHFGISSNDVLNYRLHQAFLKRNHLIIFSPTNFGSSLGTFPLNQSFFSQLDIHNEELSKFVNFFSKRINLRI